ncbi:MAG: hypothetical protein RLZZ546_888 [Bacteroidota bacterium]|jgi:hypothetical protein
MKVKFLLVVLCFVTIFSCSKNESNTEFDGTWTLIETTGGLTGQGLSTDWNKVTIEENQCIFFKDATKLTTADLSFTTSELCKSVKLIFNNTGTNVIDIRSDNIKCISISADKLEWKSDCCDRYDYIFTKVK